MADANITAARLRELVHYDPETGTMARKISRGGKHAGSQIGTPLKGYISAVIDGRHYLVHRLAWLWMTGAWPSHDLDHLDGNRSNNRWGNLREVSRLVNLQNRRIAGPRSSTGLLGVVPNHKRWSAQIRINKCNLYLGTFDTPEMAHAAYLEAKRAHHAGCTI